jgi:hypothetical protein
MEVIKMEQTYMKNKYFKTDFLQLPLFAIFLLAFLVSSCDLDNDEEVPPPVLPATVYGRLPTRNDIIQTAEAVGATNVQITTYSRASGTSQNAVWVITSGGYQPTWWRQDRRWSSSNYFPTLKNVHILYDETDNMHPDWSVRRAIHQLFRNAGFYDAISGFSPFEVGTTTDNRFRLIPLPTHASIINAIEQLGASNVKINSYVVYDMETWSLPSSERSGINWRIVPVDRGINATQGVGSKWLVISYEHHGLGSIITDNEVQNTIRELFRQYGFEVVDYYFDIRATGTLVSASFPLPSYNQIRQAAEQAGANNVQVSIYIANNINVIPMNEGSRLANTPVVVEIKYDGPAIPVVNTNIRALFANFNNAHIGNNATVTIPLPTRSNIHQAALSVLYFSATITEQPRIYTVNGVQVSDIANPGSAAWNAFIRIVYDGNGTNTATNAANAVNAIEWLFNSRGFFNLDIWVSNR